MTNSALNRTTIVQLTNKSGSALEQGSVVIVDVDNNKAFDTTTTQDYTTTNVGVVFEPFGIDNNDVGAVALAGWVPIILTSGTITRGDKLRTASTAGYVYGSATSDAGDFAEALESDTNPEAFLFGSVTQAIGAETITDVTFKSYTGVTGEQLIFEETIPALTDGIIKTKSWGSIINNDIANKNIFLRFYLDADTNSSSTIAVPLGGNEYIWTLETVLSDTGGQYVLLYRFLMQLTGSSDPTESFLLQDYTLALDGDLSLSHTFKINMNLADADLYMDTYATLIEGPYTN